MDPSSAEASFWKTRSGMAFLAFLAIAVFFLLTEHTAHVLGALPYLLLLACPLMHLFHHGKHHHGVPSRDDNAKGSAT
jgi:multisubunit Na+/H+ antiporter MnhG subunit